MARSIGGFDTGFSSGFSFGYPFEPPLVAIRTISAYNIGKSRK